MSWSTKTEIKECSIQKHRERTEQTLKLHQQFNLCHRRNKYKPTSVNPVPSCVFSYMVFPYIYSLQVHNYSKLTGNNTTQRLQAYHCFHVV